jgi:Holliday junction resolvase RusA-like endonuclease
VTRWGVYYGKKYTQWRKDAEKYLLDNPPTVTQQFTQAVELQLNHVVVKPRTSKLEYPRPDIDNYDKAAMDAITSYTDIWTDDCLVRKKLSHKQFAKTDTPQGTYITINNYK